MLVTMTPCAHRVTTNPCGIAFEHANSLQSLIASGNHTSAVALLRPQFEAVMRAIWLHYAATDTAVAKLVAPLAPETEKSAGDSPSMKDMLEAIERKAHPSASQMLARFKEQSWKPINSLVYGGIHPDSRFGEGYLRCSSRFCRTPMACPPWRAWCCRPCRPAQTSPAM